MQIHKREIIACLFAALLSLSGYYIAEAMGQRPKDKREGRKDDPKLSKKEQLAALEGVTVNKNDLLATGMNGWEQSIYDIHVNLASEVDPDTMPLFYLVYKRDVRVGLDSSFAVVVESNYYEVVWKGDCKAGYFVHGCLYVLDTMQRVSWRKEYKCGKEPMWRQSLEISSFGDKHFVVHVPDSAMVKEDFIDTYILFDYKEKEMKKFDSDNFKELTEKGKYLLLRGYDENVKSQKQIVYNLFDNDSVVVYGGSVSAYDDDKIYISSSFNLKAPVNIYNYHDVKSKIIDLRPKK